jgi:hypothetical protein
MTRLRRFAGLPAGHRILLAEAMLLLALAEIASRRRSGARLTRLLGRPGAHAPDTLTADENRSAVEVGWAVAAAARHLPWRTVCLPQALAARWLLQRRKVRSTLYLGIASAQARAAHAWVCVGPLVVTGADQADGCTIISTFA